MSFIRNIYNKITAFDHRSNAISNIILKEYGNELSANLIESVDKDTNPIPWFTYPAIEYLNQLDLTDLTILEWGCGNSTLYFAKNCKFITSIEHNKTWFDNMKNKVPSNSEILFRNETEEYFQKIPNTSSQQYDIIIVDGILRKGCIDKAIEIHSGNGFIILDNSDRNPELCKNVKESGYLEIDFHGFGPINAYTWTTSFFFKSSIRLKTKNVQPIVPIGGGY